VVNVLDRGQRITAVEEGKQGAKRGSKSRELKKKEKDSTRGEFQCQLEVTGRAGGPGDGEGRKRMTKRRGPIVKRVEKLGGKKKKRNRGTPGESCGKRERRSDMQKGVMRGRGENQKGGKYKKGGGGERKARIIQKSGLCFV